MGADGRLLGCIIPNMEGLRSDGMVAALAAPVRSPRAAGLCLALSRVKGLQQQPMAVLRTFYGRRHGALCGNDEVALTACGITIACRWDQVASTACVDMRTPMLN